MFLRSTRGLASRLFESEAARRVLPGLGLHVDVGPGRLVRRAASRTCWRSPRPRAATASRKAAPSASPTRSSPGSRSAAVEIRLGARVTRVLVRGGRAAAVVLEDGTEIAARHAVVADTSPAALLLSMVDEREVPGWVRGFMKRFPQGWGTFKVDWALSGPVPWQVEAARSSAVVHAGESVDDLARFTGEARAGGLPERPYLVIGQQSLADPTRAPAGQHTLYCYTHVPSQLEGGWAAAREGFADRVEARIEELAPGFRASILGRHVMAPPDLEAWNANLVGGDLGGGSNAWHRQLVFRPLFPYFRYRMPVAGLYLCSSYAHPGAGVHGMCGANAAAVAARDAERRGAVG